MCFRFREGLPEEAAYLKQPTRSLQDSSRDPKIDLYKFITRVLSLKYNKYVTRENNRKFKSPNEVAKHNTLGNVKRDVWCREHKALQDRVILFLPSSDCTC